MIWIIITAIFYLVVGGIVYFFLSLTDEFNSKKKIPTLLLSVFLWPLLFIVWGIAAIVK